MGFTYTYYLEQFGHNCTSKYKPYVGSYSFLCMFPFESVPVVVGFEWSVFVEAQVFGLIIS